MLPNIPDKPIQEIIATVEAEAHKQIFQIHENEFIVIVRDDPYRDLSDDEDLGWV